MKNVSYLGLCWATTFALVAAALGQQPAANFGQAGQKYDAAVPGLQAPQSNALATPANAANQSANENQQRTMPATGAQQEQSMLSGGPQSGQPAMAAGQQHGELGVWLVESGGPGVEIQRVTRGSGAEQAGLRPGDIVLQVNGRGASSPQSAAQLIRQVPIGQIATLTIWRDGEQQQLQATVQPTRQMAGETTRDSYQVGFRGDEGTTSGDSASRMMRLEQQVAALSQEVQQMRQEMAQMRGASSSQSTGLNLESNQGSALTGTTSTSAAPSTSTPAATSTAAPPPGFGQTEEKPAKSESELPKSATPPSTAPPASTPAAEKPAASNDLFGAPPSATPPASSKSDEKPKTDTKAGAADDLFK